MKVVFIDNNNIYDTDYSSNLYFALNMRYKDRLKMLFYVPKWRKGEDSKDIPSDSIRPTWDAVFYPFQILCSLLKDKPDIVHIQFEQDTFGSVYSLMLLPVLLGIIKLIQIPLIITLHGVVPLDQVYLACRYLPFPSLTLKLSIIVMYKLIGFLSDTVTVFSITFVKWLHYYGVKSSKIKILPHGVNYYQHKKIGNLRVRSSTRKIVKNKKIILYFGYFSPRKGIEHLVKAWSYISNQLPNYMLVLAGGVSKYPEYTKRILNLIEKNCQHGNVAVTGFLNKDDVLWLCHKAEFMIFPYLFSDSASGPFTLAAGLGKPVVASNISFFKDEIVHKYNGFLVEPGNSKELGQAIKFLAEKPYLKNSISTNMLLYGMNKSWGKIGESTYNIWIKNILQHNLNTSILNLKNNHL